FAAGYQRVRTPHIARESLYTKSGHLPYYAESMFPPIKLGLEGTEYLLFQRAERFLDTLDDLLATFLNIAGFLPEPHRIRGKEAKIAGRDLTRMIDYFFKSMSATLKRKPTEAMPDLTLKADYDRYAAEL